MLTIAIKSKEKFISNIIEHWKEQSQTLFLPSFKIKFNNNESRSDATLSLSRLYKKPRNHKIKKSSHVYFHSIKYKFSRKRGSLTNFMLYSEEGSFINTDVKKMAAVGKIAEQERMSFSIFSAWLTLCVLFYCRVNIHAGCIISKSGLRILFIGKSGAGKSTICNLLKRRGGFEIFDDDNINIALKAKKILIWNSPPGAYLHYPNYIFFLNKEKNSESRISPISRKEAFKRLLFASEFPKRENNINTEGRLDILNQLVKQSRCYSLINGRELKENPPSFLRLFESVIKKNVH